MATVSSNRGFQIPTVGGDSSVWGGPQINNTILGLDQALARVLVLPSSTYGTATTLTSAQTQAALIDYTASSGGSGNFMLTFASSSYGLGKFSVLNNSTGQKVICQSSAGSTAPIVSIPAGQQLQVYSWGTGITTDGVKEQIVFNVNGPTTVYKPANADFGTFSFPWAMTTTDFELFTDPSAAALSSASYVEVWRNPYNISTAPKPTDREIHLDLSSLAKAYSIAYRSFFVPGEIIQAYINSTGTAVNFAMATAVINGVRYMGSSI